MDISFYKNYFEFEKNHWWFQVRRNIVISLIEKYKIPRHAKIFDYGCGSGHTVGFLQNLGFRVYGGDSSEEAILFGRSKGIQNLSVLGDGVDFQYSEEFDLILILDVIEHIKDDRRLIKALERALKPGGMLVMTAPAYMWLWGVQDEVAHHYRRYTLKSMEDLVSGSKDLELVKSSYFNTLLFPAIVVVRLLSKAFNIKDRQSDFDINNNFLNTIFYFLFNLESKLIKSVNFPFGISILLVLKKK